MKKRANKFIFIILSLILLVSCAEKTPKEMKPEEQSSHSSHTEGSAESTPSSYVTWNPTDKLDIIYDKSTHSFSSSCPYVEFMVMPSDPGTKGVDDKEFVILNFSDIQIPFGSLRRTNYLVREFKDIASELIERVHPDLITVTGDFGDYTDLDESLRYVGDIIDSYNIPWAPVFGNHDNEAKSMLSKCKTLEKFDNCLFKTGPNNLGTVVSAVSSSYKSPVLGNYVINVVKETDNEKGYELINSLIFMNTGDLYKKDYLLDLQSWGRLTPEQIDWYEWVIDNIKNERSDAKSTLFIHIPIYAYRDAVNAAVKGAPDFNNKQNDFIEYCKKIKYSDSLNPSVWNEGYTDSFGVLHEGIGCCDTDDTVFETLKKCSSTDLVICGHDHDNNFVINYEGITLAYSTKTGRGTYYDETDTLCGGTVITITATSTDIRHEIYCPYK